VNQYASNHGLISGPSIMGGQQQTLADCALNLNSIEIAYAMLPAWLTSQMEYSQLIVSRCALCILDGSVAIFQTRSPRQSLCSQRTGSLIPNVDGSYGLA